MSSFQTLCIFFLQGAQAGTVIALPISGALADEVGWESVFYFFGILGCLWFLFWLFLCFDSPATHSRISQVRHSSSTYAKRLYYVCLFKNSLGGESVHRSPYSIKEPRHSTSIPSINRHFEEPSFHFLVNGALRAQLGTLHTIDGIANLSLQYSTLSPQGCK